MVAKHLFVFLIFALSCFRLLRFIESKLPQEEVDALQQIISTLGSKYWKFNSDSCTVEMIGLTPVPPKNAEHEIACECHYENSTVCHVLRIVLKGYSLHGILPPQLIKLPYLQEIDFAYNYLNGTIPRAWDLTRLTSISLLVNNLSGKIPKELGNIATLTYLNLEANQFSGVVPDELGNLLNLQTLMLSSNLLSGKLPVTFARLINLTDLRINDNNFNGPIPIFIEKLKQLTRLEMQASGLRVPIPSAISILNNLVEMRVTDINGSDQLFPVIGNMTSLKTLVLRNCNIFGEIPAYIWAMKNLELLDVSFNRLVGKIPLTILAKRLKFVFLSHNLLRGDVPDSILVDGSSVDLSYNNFTWQGPDQPACRENMNLNLNLFRSSSMVNNLGILPCMKAFNCPRYSNCLHVNCGGGDATVKENETKVLYEGDGRVEGGAANYYVKLGSQWGFSSTGDFLDDNDIQNRRYTLSMPSSNLPDLYSTARTSPISLTYFRYCLETGKYTVSLKFAEIQFANDRTYKSLGRRSFDIYIQDKLVRKDFNIEDEAKGAQRPLVKQFSVNVTANYLEIRFYWAGRGTTRIPERGVYGPLVSAISVVSDFKRCSHGGKDTIIYITIGVGIPCFIFFVLLGIVWWKGHLPGHGRTKDGKEQDLPMGTFTLKQIRDATNDFDDSNKIGEGGFGPVYKGLLADGGVIAVKKLSSKSRQGNREFLNEIGMISCVQHPNLVKLHGFCVEGDHLLLVYEYMENNSLARALFGKSLLKLDWPTKLKICLGIARGLAFLHEESILKIVHRDIKATNVLLDRDLNPKISDFGLARLDEEEKTHISTKIAGTIGYMAPEYALWGYLTFKADVYSYGVVVLEIVSGKSNNNYMPSGNYACLLDWAIHLQQTGDLMQFVDERLTSDIKVAEVKTVVKVALLCTNASPSLRPTMSEVVSMLEGRTTVPDMVAEPSTCTEDLRFKALKDLRQHQENYSSSGSQKQTSTTLPMFYSSSTSGHDDSEINKES